MSPITITSIDQKPADRSRNHHLLNEERNHKPIVKLGIIPRMLIDIIPSIKLTYKWKHVQIAETDTISIYELNLGAMKLVV